MANGIGEYVAGQWRMKWRKICGGRLTERSVHVCIVVDISIRPILMASVRLCVFYSSGRRKLSWTDCCA